MDGGTPRPHGGVMTLLLRLCLLAAVMTSALALSGCLVRSEPGYYGGNNAGYVRGGPPGHGGGRGNGNGHGNGHGH
jgi:hypothetical protein